MTTIREDVNNLTVKDADDTALPDDEMQFTKTPSGGLRVYTFAQGIAWVVGFTEQDVQELIAFLEDY